MMKLMISQSSSGRPKLSLYMDRGNGDRDVWRRPAGSWTVLKANPDHRLNQGRDNRLCYYIETEAWETYKTSDAVDIKPDIVVEVCVLETEESALQMCMLTHEKEES
jgi:Uma2 family endonuclease